MSGFARRPSARGDAQVRRASRHRQNRRRGDGRLLRIEAGDAVAFRFIEELGRAYDLLEQTPAAGSLRLADRVGIEGLGVWPLRTFPYSILYFETVKTIDIWRVLHAQRDVDAALS